MFLDAFHAGEVFAVAQARETDDEIDVAPGHPKVGLVGTVDGELDFGEELEQTVAHALHQSVEEPLQLLDIGVLFAGETHDVVVQLLADVDVVERLFVVVHGDFGDEELLVETGVALVFLLLEALVFLGELLALFEDLIEVGVVVLFEIEEDVLLVSLLRFATSTSGSRASRRRSLV